MMVASRYNIYDEKNFSYIANTLTGACIQVTKEEILGIKHGKLEVFSDEEIAVLEENGIIIDSELVEIQLLRNAYNFCKYTNKRATITIAPSLDCNFDCSYCYEEKSKERMSEMIKNQVLLFLHHLLEENQIQELNICWYGGEPILCIDIIKQMSAKIMAVCKEIGSTYHASIITNGYLVDDKIVDILKICKIRTAQVTLDGTKETHDTRRRLMNGQGTYEKIKRAVFLLADNGINVAVRVNLDKSNLHEYKSVYEIFKGNENINCYPAIVTVEENQTIYQKALCYAHTEFEKFYDAIWEDIYEDEKRKIELSMQSGICSCAAEHVHSYLIGPNGNLYKCLNDICNGEYAVGHVSGDISGTLATAKYLGRDPFTEPECSKCPYIPICYGGCVFEYKKHNTHACKAVKYMYRKCCQKKIGGERYEDSH